MNRRDFLRPRQLATRAGQVLGALDDLQTAVQEVARPRPVVGPEFALVHYSRQAMATTFEVMLPLGTPQALKAAQDALDEINRLEEQLTVYRDTSEVSRLNRELPSRPFRSTKAFLASCRRRRASARPPAVPMTFRRELSSRPGGFSADRPTCLPAKTGPGPSSASA